MSSAALIILSIALFIVAAKTHGRHVRLERELQGVWKVDFRSTNPPAVEAVWRKDRIVFWTTAALIAILAIAYQAIAGTTSFAAHARATLGPMLTWLLIGVVWPMITAFMVAGVASAYRSYSAFAERSATVPSGWKESAINGSIVW